MFQITDAKREQLYGALALVAPSGAGKTIGALKLAKGIIEKMYPELSEEEVWKKVGFIDTEHKRSKIYANTSSFGTTIDSFKHIDFPSPYTIGRLDQAVKLLKDNGCEVIIIDSASHFWEGEGGILELHQNNGGRFQDWKETNKDYQEFIRIITGEKYDVDVISGIRTKQDYQAETTETGKLEVKKLGLKPVQRDNLEYEFHIALTIDMNHIAKASKDNSGIFEGHPRRLEVEDGHKLHAWLREGVDVLSERKKQKEEEEAKKKADLEKRQKLSEEARSYTQTGMKEMDEYAQSIIDRIEKKTGKNKLHLAPSDRLEEMIKYLDETYRKAKKKYGSEQKNEAPKEEAPTEEEEKKTLKGLREVAKSFKIKGYSKMNKDELLEAIEKAQKEQKQPS